MSYCNTHRSDTAHSSTIEGLTTPRVAEAPAAQTGSEAVPGVGAAAPCAPVASLSTACSGPSEARLSVTRTSEASPGHAPEAPPAGDSFEHPQSTDAAPSSSAAVAARNGATDAARRAATPADAARPDPRARSPERNLFLVSSLFIYIVLSYLFFARICIPPAPPPRSEPLPARVADIG